MRNALCNALVVLGQMGWPSLDRVLSRTPRLAYVLIVRVLITCILLYAVFRIRRRFGEHGEPIRPRMIRQGRRAGAKLPPVRPRGLGPDEHPGALDAAERVFSCI